MATMKNLLTLLCVAAGALSCGNAARDDGHVSNTSDLPSRELPYEGSAAAADENIECRVDLATETEPLRVEDVPVGAAPTKGSRDAPITIVVFADFECSYCARLADTLAAIETQYGPDVRLAFRNKPLPCHRPDQGAARAAIGATEQGSA